MLVNNLLTISDGFTLTQKTESFINKKQFNIMATTENILNLVGKANENIEQVKAQLFEVKKLGF